MSGVTSRKVAADDAEMRLDRWFKRHFPALSHIRLEKLLRTGQIRVDGKRVKAGERLEAGQEIRIPPLGDAPSQPPRPKAAPKVSDHDAKDLQSRVLYKDKDLIALDKPAGLAVQGGTKTDKHLDAMLDALIFDAKERPRLVHRLDRDTSGLLILARSAASAARLGEAFKGRTVRKIYWALVAGLPTPREGKIDAPLAKLPGRAGERVAVDAEEGKRAVSLFRTLDHAGARVSWLELEPLTGRTHQLRAHCALLGTPILGDGKYGGAEAFVDSDSLAKQMHLHARALLLPRPGAKPLRLVAPLSPHMKAAFRFLGFEEGRAGDPFAD